MEELKVSVYEGVDVIQGLIFLDEDAYEIQNISAVEIITLKPNQTLYRICTFGGLTLMFFGDTLAILGFSSILLGITIWALGQPRRAVFLKTLPNRERFIVSKSLEELEKISRALKSAHHWQKNL